MADNLLEGIAKLWGEVEEDQRLGLPRKFVASMDELEDIINSGVSSSALLRRVPDPVTPPTPRARQDAHDGPSRAPDGPSDTPATSETDPGRWDEPGIWPNHCPVCMSGDPSKRNKIYTTIENQRTVKECVFSWHDRI